MISPRLWCPVGDGKMTGWTGALSARSSSEHGSPARGGHAAATSFNVTVTLMDGEREADCHSFYAIASKDSGRNQAELCSAVLTR